MYLHAGVRSNLVNNENIVSIFAVLLKFYQRTLFTTKNLKHLILSLLINNGLVLLLLYLNYLNM